MFDNLKNIAIATCVSLAIGFGAGFYVAGKFEKAGQFEAVTDAQHQTAQNVQQSLEQSSAVEAKVTASSEQVTTIRQEVARHLKEKEKEIATNEPNSQVSDCGPWCLDVRTVRLLNSARTGAAFDSASLGDAEGKAASGLELSELLDNDLQVIDLYRELATRHDALVDYVQSIIDKQADQ